MSEKEVDLKGRVCPFPVMSIIREVDNMEPGKKIVFHFDDPLVLKSVPEELQEYDNITFDVVKKDGSWEMSVIKK